MIYPAMLTAVQNHSTPVREAVILMLIADHPRLVGELLSSFQKRGDKDPSICQRGMVHVQGKTGAPPPMSSLQTFSWRSLLLSWLLTFF